MPPIDGQLVAIALVAGVLALATATTLATRHEPAVRRGRLRAAAPVVPWLGSVLVVVLLVRASYLTAGLVAAATVLHAVASRSREALRDRVERWRADGRRP